MSAAVDTAPGAAPAPQRRPEIDRLKGLAILGVLLIHARPLVGTPLGDHVVNRAVPVFLVLFGMTSEMWWRAHGAAGARRTLLAWYRGRARRLLVPLWATLAVWWAIVVTLGGDVPVAPRFVVATALGYLPWLGTGWFITVILQLVVLFPAVHWCARRLGAPASLALTAAVLAVSYAFMFEITAGMRRLLLDSGPRQGLEAFYYFWIFVPARLFGVVAGMVLAWRVTRPEVVPERPATAPPAGAVGESQGPARGSSGVVGPRLTAGAAMVLAIGWLVMWRWLGDPRELAGLSALLDVPLTLVLLAAIALLPAASNLARALAWCGRASWGIYLGQMLIHDGLHAFALRPEEAALGARWAYFACLLGGAVALVAIGTAVRRAASGLMPIRE
jgi:peptidoglycan/LPS O-acetylase OafA/YrhL